MTRLLAHRRPAELLARLLVAAALVFHAAAWLPAANPADSLASIERSDKQQPIASQRPATLAAIKPAGEPARPQAAAGDAILAAHSEIAGITGLRSTPRAPDLRATPADPLAYRARAPPLA